MSVVELKKRVFFQISLDPSLEELIWGAALYASSYSLNVTCQVNVEAPLTTTLYHRTTECELYIPGANAIILSGFNMFIYLTSVLCFH